jgi:hypothetical protein
MIPDNVGTSPVHCHVSLHNEEGNVVRHHVEA